MCRRRNGVGVPNRQPRWLQPKQTIRHAKGPKIISELTPKAAAVAIENTIHGKMTSCSMVELEIVRDGMRDGKGTHNRYTADRTGVVAPFAIATNDNPALRRLKSVSQ